MSDASFRNCPYCGTVLPHEARAAERAAVARELLEDRDGDGVPDGLAPLLEAQQQAQQQKERQDQSRGEQARKARELDQARQQLTTLRASGSLGCGAVMALAAALLAAVVWSVIAAMALEVDPWLGLHGRVFCPLVCTGCRGPYRLHAWRSGSGRDASDHLAAFCHNPAIDLDTLDRNGLVTRREELEPYELPGGLAAFVVTTFPLLFVFVLPIAVLRMRRNRRAGIALLTERVERLAASMGEPERGGG